jgi:hypothetical protein
MTVLIKAQLLIFQSRANNTFDAVSELKSMEATKGTATCEDVYERVSGGSLHALPWKKLVNVTTDGNAIWMVQI